MMTEEVRGIWASFQSPVGLVVARDGDPWSIAFRSDELMPQQSVSKLWVAIALLDAVDRGEASLAEHVTLTDADYTVFHQPIVERIKAGDNTFTLAELLEMAMTKSDNTANNTLLKRLGGPQAVRAMISAKGLGAIRFGPGEMLLQAGTAGLEWKPEYRFGRSFQAARAALPEETRRRAMAAYIADPPDGAAPMAIARALIRLKRGDLLSPSSTARLLRLMESSETGKQRVRAGLPPGWRWAHKTGTGQDLNGTTAGYNDIGIATAPDGTNYAIVIMMRAAYQSVPQRMAFMQQVASAVVRNHEGAATAEFRPRP